MNKLEEILNKEMSKYNYRKLGKYLIIDIDYIGSSNYSEIIGIISRNSYK